MPVKTQRSHYGQRWTARRGRDLAIYLLIAFVIAFGIVWFAYNSEATQNDRIARWGGLIVNTAILYAYVVKESRPFWHAWGFWLAVISVLSVHAVVFIVLLQRVEHWSVLWFLVMYPIEIPALAVICDWSVHVTGGQPRYRADAQHRH